MTPIVCLLIAVLVLWIWVRLWGALGRMVAIRGREKEGFILGAVFGPLGILIAALLKQKDSNLRRVLQKQGIPNRVTTSRGYRERWVLARKVFRLCLIVNDRVCALVVGSPLRLNVQNPLSYQPAGHQ